MKEKVKKFFSEIFVNAYDYPFIIGFLEANGIEGIVPSLKQKGNRTCINYENFKEWWKHNYEADKPECATVSIEDGDFEFHAEVNHENGLIEYTITQGGKSAVIKLDENANTFMLCNTQNFLIINNNIYGRKSKKVFLRDFCKDIRLSVYCRLS